MTGSFSGLLRIYKPQKNKFQVADLLLEQQLEQPILQIELGRFMAYVHHWWVLFGFFSLPHQSKCNFVYLGSVNNGIEQ